MSVSEARSTLGRDMAPSVSAADQRAVEDASAAFAFDLYAQLPHSASNLFFSPYSIYATLVLPCAGAGGTTASEMAKALRFPLPLSQLPPDADWLDLQVDSSTTSQSFLLVDVTSAWANRGVTFGRAFLDTLAVNYGAGVWTADFADAAAAREAINAWVATQTNEQIESALPASAITPGTPLVLVDGATFHGTWARPFQPSLTAKAAFTKLDGSTEQVPMMAGVATLPYASGSGWEAVELPYAGGRVAMDVILPAAGHDADFEASLSASTFASAVAALQPTNVKVTLPKFHVGGTTTSLKGALEALGMPSAFVAGADFAAIAPGLRISDVLHQATVEVDEQGTQALSAASGGSSAGAATPSYGATVAVSIERPFFVAIRDLRTGTVLFAGKILDPVAQE
jgi:serpin B